MATKTPTDAEARLTDLDVREVSVVDRPANKRRFLIVKRAGEGLAVIRTEEPMSRTAIPREAAAEFGHVLETDDDELVSVLKEDDLTDLIAMGEDVPDTDDADADDESPLVEIEKGDAADAIKVTKAVLAKLMAVANKLKSSKEKAGGKLPPTLAPMVRTIAQALSALVEKLKGSKGDDKPKGKAPVADEDAPEAKSKAAADAMAVVTAVIEKLMGAVSALKALAPDAAVPAPVLSAVSAAATSLMSLAESAGGGDEEMSDKDKAKPPVKEPKEQAKAARPEVFVSKADDPDPEIIIKAGTKMKRTRFSLFKKAVEMLTEILKELEDAKEEAAAALPGGKKKKPSAAQKADDDFQQALMTKLDGIKDDVGKVNKRVDELETARPTGADDDPPKPVAKKASLWGNVLGTRRE